MSAAFLLAYLYLRRRDKLRAKIKKRQLRDASNPMCIPEEAFIALYRINKAGFLMILNEIAPLIRQSRVPENLQLAAALRFLAVGAFEGVMVNDVKISLGRSTFSKVLWKVMEAVEKKICPKWINLKMSKDETHASMLHFYKNYEIPSVIGCVDCTHVRIKNPSPNEYLFYNPKGHFSLNVLLICDYKMRIRAIDANKHGSTEDEFVWCLSELRRYFQNKHDNGERNGWLLGDCDFELEPYLLTPYKNPDYGSKEYSFNYKLYSARSTVEKTIVNLQSRLRCLQTTTLHYSPQEAVRTVNVCSALHNICKYYNIEIEDTISSDSDDENDDDGEGEEDINEEGSDDENVADSEEENDEMNKENEGIQIRDSIAESLSKLNENQ